MSRCFYVFAILLLSACKVGNDFEMSYPFSDKDIQENLNLSADTSAVTPTWYNIFNDSDLNTLLTHALNKNLSLKQALERLQQSRYSLMINSKNNFPMIDASGGYEFSKASNSHDYRTDVNTFNVGLDASWEVDIWGKGAYITEQYYEFMRNYQYSLEDLKVSITAEVVSNYINLRMAQEKLRIALANLNLQQDIFETVQQKFEAGIADKLALNQAMYVVETTKAQIPPLKIQVEQFKNAVALLLGVIPSQLPVNLDKYRKNITAKAFPFNTKKLYNLPLNVVRSRPDVKAAESQIRAQNAAVNEAIANLYPSLSLSASFGYISSSGHSLFNKHNQDYSYSPTLSLPIWHWGQLTNNIELQKHIKEEYLLNYNETMLTALTEIKNAITAVEQAYTAGSHSKNSYNKMQNIMNLTQTKYKNGLVDFTDVATAEQNLLNAQNALIDSNAAILQNLTAFYKASGGGYNFGN